MNRRYVCQMFFLLFFFVFGITKIKGKQILKKTHLLMHGTVSWFWKKCLCIFFSFWHNENKRKTNFKKDAITHAWYRFMVLEKIKKDEYKNIENC